MNFFKKKDDSIQNNEVVADLRRRITGVGLPETVRAIAEQEMDILTRISPSSAEFTIGLTYVDYLFSLPWCKRTEDNLNLTRAELILDEHHYGLQAIKERILEHLAVKALRATGSKRVLIVDDEEIARKNLAHVLTKESCDVVTAPDAETAIRELAVTEFDVVLTDLRMGKLGGLDVLETVKRRHPETRVIIITGYASVPSAIDAMKKGAFNYIAKPYKLDEVRETVRQALDRKTLSSSAKGTVLCFSGPPGTGKTSLGRSIALALGRSFSRIALGGIKDEADIRGHRRTYVGARPGRILEEIRRVESSNPVLMLDELDKIGSDFKGDPSSALLEVLDPEQNRSFTDHYLDVPFDLSGVMFILTANIIDAIPAPLRDRMEVIEFSGYTHDEKRKIASRFLVPKQLREKGLSTTRVSFSDNTLDRIIIEYTREAGIRNLERKIAAICRKIARESLRSPNDQQAIVVTPILAERYLGRPRLAAGILEERDCLGVAVGLVRTETGGDIIFVEAVKMKGSKELIITGSLGEVMRESAQAALSFIRSNSRLLGVPDDFFERQDIHIHVPSGAIQKDGPSAGITIAMALLSLLTGRPARRNVAMSGEITLTGRILPVAGIKDKILAARRAGVITVILPSRNRIDVDDLDKQIINDISFLFADNLSDIIDAVLT